MQSSKKVVLNEDFHVSLQKVLQIKNHSAVFNDKSLHGKLSGQGNTADMTAVRQHYHLQDASDKHIKYLYNLAMLGKDPQLSHLMQGSNSTNINNHILHDASLQEKVTHVSRLKFDYAESLVTGTKAIIQTGFPPHMMTQMLLICNATKSSISIRAGAAPVLGLKYQHKPMDVKANTGAFKLFYGLIPSDENYLKAKSKPIDDDKHNNREKFGVSQLKVSLYQVLMDQDNYTIKIQGDEMFITPKNIDPNDAQAKQDYKDPNMMAATTFIINLKEGQAPPNLSDTQEKELMSIKNQDRNFSFPGQWSPAWGNLDERLHDLRDVEYTRPGKDQREAFMVLGNPPVTGDMDLFWISPGNNPEVQNIANVNKPYDLNRMDPKQSAEFFTAFNKISALYQQRTETLDLGLRQGEDRVDSPKFARKARNTDTEKGVLTRIRSSSLFQRVEREVKSRVNSVNELAEIGITGIATPAEAAMIHLVNQKFGKEAAGIIQQLILHGPESNNPGKPSSIENVLHILPDSPLGNFVMTRDQQELLELVKSPGFIEHFPIPIHPEWPMKHWAPVIDKMIEYHGEKSVSEATLAKRQEYIPDNNVQSPRGMNYGTLSKALGDLNMPSSPAPSRKGAMEPIDSKSTLANDQSTKNSPTAANDAKSPVMAEEEDSSVRFGPSGS